MSDDRFVHTRNRTKQFPVYEPGADLQAQRTNAYWYKRCSICAPEVSIQYDTSFGCSSIFSWTRERFVDLISYHDTTMDGVQAKRNMGISVNDMRFLLNGER